MLRISDCDVGGCACAYMYVCARVFCMCVQLVLSAAPEVSSRTALTLPRLTPDQLQAAGCLPQVLHFCILQSIYPVNSQQVTE